MKFRQLRIGRLSIYAAKISRGNNGNNPPWRGYCWGSDWPRIQFGKGGNSMRCVQVSWLMFFVTAYWTKRATKVEGAAP